jgi:phosphoglycerate dehydrogenase-like enzyme
MRGPLTIWTNALLSDVASAFLREAISPHRLIRPAVLPTAHLAAGTADPRMAEADVAFGQPDPQSVIDCPRLEWVHLTSAGYARYDNEPFRAALAARRAVLTNSSQVYAEPCAEHALAMILGLARQLPQSVEAQRSERSWPGVERRANSSLLKGQSVLLLGFGAIARRLAQLLVPFEMKITAVRRKQGDAANGVALVSEAEMTSALRSADHVVNLLPSSPATQRFVNAERFAAMKCGAVFYNIGRGETVDQHALIVALETGALRAAYLDVTQPEPLPPEHLLWTAPNCFITPHTAGGFTGEDRALVQHFVENLDRWTSGAQLVDQIH